MSKLIETSDYEIFKKHPNNRALEVGNLRRIENSIRSLNLLAYRPILVDKEMRVIDGQHRLEAAKKLKLSVFYQIQEEEEEDTSKIILLNANQKNWGYIDYINFYETKGNINYLKLREFMNENELGVSEALTILGQRGGSVSHVIRSGSYKFPEKEKADRAKIILMQSSEVVKNIDRYLLSNKEVLTSLNFRRALYLILCKEEVCFDVLLKKTETKAESIKKCSGVVGYYEMLKGIYNWKNQNPMSD